MTMHAVPATLIRQLDDEQIAYELIPHRRTETALAEADALGVEPRQVAKTIVLTTRRVRKLMRPGLVERAWAPACDCRRGLRR